MRRLLLIPLLLLAAAPLRGADAPGGSNAVRFTVSETAGLRRFGYPVTARVLLPQGGVREAKHLRLESSGGPVSGVQYDERARWPDGSLKLVELSFNSSPGPLQTVELQLRYGAEVTHVEAGPPSVQETPEAFIIRGTYRIPRGQREFLDSVRYGGREFLESPAVWTGYTTQGLAPVSLEGRKSRVVSHGAVNAVVELSGHLDAKKGPLPFTLTLSQPNSKSWFDAVMEVEDPRQELTSIGLAAGYKLEQLPALYDFGVGSWVYGTLKERQSAQLLASAERGWQILTTTGTLAPSVYAAASPVQPRFEGWAHLVDGKREGRAVAFGSPDFLPERGMEGSFRVQADGTTGILWNLKPEPRHRVQALFHHVGDPVHVTAVTSPAAMLHPLVVKLLPGNAAVPSPVAPASGQ